MAKLSRAERMEKLQKMIEGEKKLAAKLDEEIHIGSLEDFKITGLDNFMLTGVLGMDLNTNGIKKGTISVIYGSEGSGKSTITLESIAGIQMQEPDAMILYIDAEQTVDKNFLNRIPNINPQNIVFIKEGIMEKALDKAFEYLSEGLFDYLIIDSVDSMISEKESEKGLDEAVMMEKARILSRALPKLNTYLADFQMSAIFIQQERIEFMGMIAKSKSRSGGKAMRFYPASVVQLSKVSANNDKEKDEFENDKITTQYCKIKNDKSKISEPYRETFTYINSDRSKKQGIEKIKECIGYAIAYKLIKKGGAWFEFVNGNGEIKKVQGEKNVLVELTKDLDLYSYLKLQIYAKGLPPELFIAKYDSIIELIKKENQSMKKRKMEKLIVINKPELIDEKDKKEFEIIEKGPEEFLSQEDFELGKFNLMSYDEQQKILEEKEAQMKQAIVAAQNEGIEEIA